MMYVDSSFDLGIIMQPSDDDSNGGLLHYTKNIHYPMFL